MFHIKTIILACFSIILSFEIAFASDKKTGLPQLDINTYPSLIFWSVISLIIGYFLMAYLVTPRIKSILNLRETNIQNDLIKAKTSNQEAEKIKSEISNNQLNIKISSQTLINDALLEAKILLEKSDKKISEKMDLRIIKAEKKINEIKDKVISEILNNAEDIAKDIVQKFTNIKPLKEDIKKTVYTVSKNMLMEK